MLLEVCVESVAGARAAASAGADRIELCADLFEGGITPSAGLLREVVRAVELPVFVMIRPRGGDFSYDESEIAVQLADIEHVKTTGAAGVVLGALTPAGDVDESTVRRLVEAARPLQVTFHRAFDVCREPLAALDTLMSLGIDRLLTSGQETSALDGCDLIARLVRHAGDRCAILAGGGIREENIRDVVRRSDVSEIHVSARGVEDSPMRHRNPRCPMGATSIREEYTRAITDAARVQKFRSLLEVPTRREE